MVAEYRAIILTARYEFAPNQVIEIETRALWERGKLSVVVHFIALNGVEITGLPQMVLNPTTADRALVENRLGTTPLEIAINMSALEDGSEELTPVGEVECFENVLVLEASEKCLSVEIRKSVNEEAFAKLLLSAEAREPGVADKFISVPSEGWEIQLG